MAEEDSNEVEKKISGLSKSFHDHKAEWFGVLIAIATLLVIYFRSQSSSQSSSTAVPTTGTNTTTVLPSGVVSSASMPPSSYDPYGLGAGIFGTGVYAPSSGTSSTSSTVGTTGSAGTSSTSSTSGSAGTSSTSSTSGTSAPTAIAPILITSNPSTPTATPTPTATTPLQSFVYGGQGIAGWLHLDSLEQAGITSQSGAIYIPNGSGGFIPVGNPNALHAMINANPSLKVYSPNISSSVQGTTTSIG